jgi:hypothetical protein
MRRRPPRNQEACESHWPILSHEDQEGYRLLQQSIEPLCIRTNRSEVAAKFRIILSQITKYSTRFDDNDWKRELVCGLLWLDEAILVNVQKLLKLVRKSKSFVNFCFQSIGYESASLSPAEVLSIAQRFERTGINSLDSRQWTIRKPRALGELRQPARARPAAPALWTSPETELTWEPNETEDEFGVGKSLDHIDEGDQYYLYDTMN